MIYDKGHLVGRSHAKREWNKAVIQVSVLTSHDSLVPVHEMLLHNHLISPAYRCQEGAGVIWSG